MKFLNYSFSIINFQIMLFHYYSIFWLFVSLRLTRNSLQLLAFHPVSCRQAMSKEGSYQPRPWLHLKKGDVVKVGPVSMNIANHAYYTGHGTGPADPVIARPKFAV